jgi:phosphoribosylformylglycinamidine synthase
MWPLSCEGEMSKLYVVAKEMCDTLINLGIGIDGGKDSLSMSVKTKDKIIKSPGELVITGYAPCNNIYKKVTPNLKQINSNLILINVSNVYNKCRLGGSVFSRECLNNNNNLECPEFNDCENLIKIFNIIQTYIYNGDILSLHDVSDGGLITTICEMAISSGIGVDLLYKVKNKKQQHFYEYLFNEELGIVCEVENKILSKLTEDLNKLNINYEILGYTNNLKQMNIWKNDIIYEKIHLTTISKYWESTSTQLDKYQSENKFSAIEFNEITKLIKPYYYLSEHLKDFCTTTYLSNINIKRTKYKVAIIRDEGSNGDKEMCGVFKYVGFDVYNINMTQLLQNPEILKTFRGIVYVGGFSHSDVLGASHGWYLSIKHNIKLSNELDVFLNRDDTFSLGVCNGCQLMVKQNIFDENLKLVKNDSCRFESRYSTVQILDDDNIFFKNMKNMVFGIWVAHGEGKFVNTTKLLEKQKIIKYVQPSGSDYVINENVSYPYNPNGSEDALAGILSLNGRHLAMMPHPERCFMKWQLPYLEEYGEIKNSPWLMMFKNIFDWCSI